MNDALAESTTSRKHLASRYTRTRGQVLQILEAAHKEELDHREGLWRAVPAMIAGFAFYIAAAGYTLRNIKSADNNEVYWQFMISLTLCSGTFAFAAFILALAMLRYRAYEALPYQDETVAYFGRVVDRLEWDRGSGRFTDDECDNIALARVQMVLIDDMAHTISANRKIDEPRYLQRGKAFTYLCYSYAFLAIPVLSVTLSQGQAS